MSLRNEHPTCQKRHVRSKEGRGTLKPEADLEAERRRRLACGTGRASGRPDHLLIKGRRQFLPGLQDQKISLRPSSAQQFFK